MEKKLVLGMFLGLFVIISSFGLVSAYNGFGSSGNPVTDLFYNEIFQIGLIVILFFALIFLALLKSKFVENKGVAVAIAATLSFLIVASLYRRGYIDTYGGSLGDWFLVLGFLIILFFVLGFLYSKLSKGVLIGLLFVVWFIIQGTNPYYVNFFSGFPEVFFKFWLSVQGVEGFIGIIIISLVILSFKSKKVRRVLNQDLGRLSVGDY